MDKDTIAKHIAEVRSTGQVNMLDRLGVVSILITLGHYETADYLYNCGATYVELLSLSGKY